MTQTQYRVTEWFDGAATRPNMPGYYERQYERAVYRDYFDGERWFAAGDESKGEHKVEIGDELQALPWRGLASYAEWFKAQIEEKRDD
jgi:hypothetical protein